jgi:hypothetical protein
MEDSVQTIEELSKDLDPFFKKEINEWLNHNELGIALEYVIEAYLTTDADKRSEEIEFQIEELAERMNYTVDWNNIESPLTTKNEEY